MNSERFNDIRWLLLPEMICVLLITFFTMIGAYSLVSFSFYCSFIIIFISTLQHFFKYKKINGILLVLICLILFSVLMNRMLNGDGLGNFNYYKKLIMFISSILLYYYVTGMTISQRLAKRLKMAMLVNATLLPISYYMVGNTGTLAHLITINYTNPNFTGMWLLLSIASLIYLFFSYKSILFKVICLFFGIINVNLLLMNNTRSCILGLIFIVFMLCIGYLLKKNNLNSFTTLCIILMPLLFAFIYLQLVDNLDFISQFDFMTSEGKTLTSRSGIWKYVTELIKNHPLIGDYWGLSGGTGQSQSHNTALDILASYGFFVYFLYVLILYKCTRFVTNNKSWTGFVAIISFFGIHISGCFEAALVSGSMGLSIAVGMLLVFGKHDYQEEKCLEQI